MAREIRSFTLTIPAGTPQSAPVSVPMQLGARRVDQLEIIVPPGGGGLMGFAVFYSGVRIIPYLSDQWIVTAGETINWPLEDQPTNGDWQAVGYNTGANAHSVYFRFLLSLVTDKPAVGLIGFDVGAVNDLAPSSGG